MTDDERQWAECDICGISTDPSRRLPWTGNQAVLVEQTEEPGHGWRIVHEHCKEEGFPSSLDQYL